MEVKNSNLCIFDKQPVQTDILRTTTAEYFPVTSLDSGGPIEFVIPGNGSDYIDCSKIFLEVHIKVTKGAGSVIEATDKVGLNNLAIATLFRDVSFEISNKLVEGGDQLYPYKAYFRSITENNKDVQNSTMQCYGWYPDQPGKFEDDANTGFVSRSKEIAGSRVCDLYGPLYLDFTRQTQLLISNTSIRLKLTPNSPEFILNSYATTPAKFKVSFEYAALFVDRCYINPSVISGHSRGLQKFNAVYPVAHTEIVTFTIPKGQKSYIKDRIFPSDSPKMLMIALVDNTAFTGDIKMNPFNFQHFDLNKIVLYRDGEPVNHRELTPDFDKKNFTRTYASTMTALNYFNNDNTNGLTKDAFANGYTFYAYDLTPTKDITALYRTPSTTTNLRLELNFKNDLADTINVLVYAVFDSEVQITALRDPILAYNR